MPRNPRTWGWGKTVLLGAAFALVGTQVNAQVTVTGASVGNGSYATLGAAFTAVGAATGTIDMAIGPLGTTETATATLNAGSWTSITVRPTVPGIIVEGSIAGAVVKLNGADNVTFDGRISGSGRNLTIRNNSTASTTAAIWLASVIAGNGCTGNTVRNCEIACGVNQNTSTNNTWGIIMSGTTISNTSNGVDNDNNTFQENRIIKCRHGIVTRGTTTNLNENIQVIDNIVGPTAFGVDQIGIVGIFMQADNNSTVRGNTVQFVGGTFANTTGGADRVGIAIGNNSWSATTTTTITSTNYTVTRNLIHDIIEERTFSAAGMLLGTTNGANPTNNLVCSNMIYNVKSNGTGGDMPVGLGISGGNGDQVVYNSIRMEGDVDPDAAASAASNYGAGIRTTNTAGTHLNLTLKNNIVYMDLSSSSGPTVRYYCASGTAAAYNWGTGGSNNNDFYYNTGNVQCLTGGLGTTSGLTNTTQFTTLANWQTAYTPAQDGASIQADPGFVSTTDLHINLGSTAVNNVGTTTGVTCTVDFDNATRSLTTPDIGADEYTPLVCAGAAGGTIAPATVSACSGATYNMSTTGSEVGAGVTYKWEVSPTGGGVGFVDVTTGSGFNTVSHTTAALTAGTFYYRLRVTCSFGPVTGYSNELTLTVNPTPTATATNNGPACVGGLVNFDGVPSAAGTYAWTGPNSFSSTEEDPTRSGLVLADAGTYSFTVTVAGCPSSAATTVVAVIVAPTVATTTATPNPTCFNGNSQLNVAASQPTAANQLAYSYSTGQSLDPMTGSVLLVSSLTDDAPMNTSNGVNTTAGASIPLPFSFNFNSTAYSHFAASPDGWVRLLTSNTASTSQFTNAVTSTTNIPKLYAYWDDMATGTNGSVSYVVTGTTPNRILKIQWFVTIPRNTSGAANSTFQTWLYETSGTVEHRYGTMGAGAMSASVGVTALAANFQSVTVSTNTVSTASANDVNAGQPLVGDMYRFAGPTLSYSWSPSTFIAGQETLANPLATNVSAASTPYTVTVSNGSCPATGNVTLTTTAPITAATITGTLSYCAGGSTTLTAVPTDGAGPYTYLWSPGGDATAAKIVTAPGNYSCQVTDFCTGSVNTGNVTVIENANPAPSITPGGPVSFCDSGMLTSSIASGNVWTPGGATTQSITALASGSYSVTVTDGNGCVGTSATVAVTVNASPAGVTANASDVTVCDGDLVDLTSTPGLASPTILTENFNGVAAGWTAVNSSSTTGSGDPALVAWTLRPNGYNTAGTWSAVLNSNDASQFYLTNSDAGGSGVSGLTFLSSPAMNLANYSAASLSFYHYYRDLGATDTARVQVTTNGGASWTDAQVYSATTGAPTAWVVANISLNAYAGQSAVQLRFRYRSGWDYGWGVDNVSVTGTPVPYMYSWASNPIGFSSTNQNPTGVTVSPVPTTYTVTVTANGCPIMASVTVNPDNTDTDGDGFLDCVDNCPLLPGQQGDVCDADPGPGFLFGAINGTCTCVAVPCTENVTVDLRTDLNSDEAGWEILLQSSAQVVCKGGYPDTPYANNITNPIVEGCCLPVGCYRLRVLDSAGDGFTSAGFTGGYQLRESGPTGRRIIDNFENFSTGSTSAISNVYENGAFCVPLSNDELIFSSCDKLDWVDYKYLVCHANAAVSAEWVPSGPNNVQDANSGYEFWIFDPNGSYSYRRFHAHNVSDGFSPASATRAARIKINGWYNSPSTPLIPANVMLNVRVRGRVNGVNGAFGPACRMKIDAARAACPLVKLQDDPTNVSDYSCGVTRAVGGPNSGANKLVALPPQFSPAPLAGGTGVRFQFRFRIPAENVCIVRPPQASPTIYLNWTNGPQLLCNKTYEVEVRVSKDLGATWCIDAPSPACDPSPVTTWGKTCNVTTSACFQGPGQSSMTAQGNGALTMYPNPNNGDQLTISLTEVARDVRTMSVDIYDLTGKRITARTIAVQDGFVTTVLDLNGDIANGMYMVNITAGEKTYTERLVIQK